MHFWRLISDYIEIWDLLKKCGTQLQLSLIDYGQTICWIWFSTQNETLIVKSEKDREGWDLRMRERQKVKERVNES